jgi:two-component system sensor histidine kinase VicK
VNLIIDRLNAYIDRAKFQTIAYKRNDEFAPLVSTINSLYKSLRVQENIRSNFLSDISHEIRTPITAVKCYLEAIEDGMMALDNKTIPLLQNELTRLTTITEKIMEYEHLTHHYTDDIHIERFALKKQIETLIYEYIPQLEKTEQHITVIGDTDIFIRMDKNMFIQILHNVFSNFIKYAGNSTNLVCSYNRTKDHIQIIFDDNGIGIPESEISLVREKFYRIDKSRTHDKNMSM